MDQNTSIIAELRAEQVDQISDNVSRPSYHLASLDTSADADSSSSSPLPLRLQWALGRLKELFNELELEQLVVVRPRIRKLMDLGRASETNGLGWEIDEFGQRLGSLKTIKEKRSKIPVVRYLPCIPDFRPSEVNGPAPLEWLAMFVHSDVPSVCIEDHNACCNVCLEDFEEPPLALESQVDGGDDGTQASPKPLRKLICGHVFHEDCLPMFQEDDCIGRFECPACRTEFWNSEQFALLSTGRDSVSSDQQQTYDDYYNKLLPWQKIQEGLLDWATWLCINNLDEFLNSTACGHPVDESALYIWAIQTYKRYVYSRLTDSPEGVVDYCFVGPWMEDFSRLVSQGEHEYASQMLRGSWDNWGLQDAPRLLAVLSNHRHQDEPHWVVHRFSLPDGGLTTYHFHSELNDCPDCRPTSWWPAIRLTWPDAAISPNPGIPTLVHVRQPIQLAVDDAVAVAGVWHNILMGLPAEHSVDLERLRDLMYTEVNGLHERFTSWVNYLSTFFGDLYGRCLCCVTKSGTASAGLGTRERPREMHPHDPRFGGWITFTCGRLLELIILDLAQQRQELLAESHGSLVYQDVQVLYLIPLLPKSESPPSHTSNPPPNDRPGASRSNGNTPSQLSSSISSTSEPDFTSRSETSSSRSTSPTRCPSGSSNSSASPSSSASHHHHSYFHTSHNTHNEPGRSSPASASTSETTPLLKKPSRSHFFTRQGKGNLFSYLVIILATLLGALFFVLSRSTFMHQNPNPRSRLTSFWVDVIPSDCHSIGTREYTATLAGIPKDWDLVTACQMTPLVVHGKVVQSEPSCSLVAKSSGSIVVMGRWLVDFDESDCHPIWSNLYADDCVANGTRSYHAEMDYVPSGMDRLASCREAPNVIHGRSLFPSRCAVVLKRGEGSLNNSLIARGEWDVDFNEDGCIPSWGPLISQQCVSHNTRLYLADLIVPPGLEGIASTLCAHTPATIRGRRVFPNRCEMVVKHDEGHPNHSLVARGEWDINFDEDGCIPSWGPLISQQCVSHSTRLYLADLIVPPGLEGIASTLCAHTPATIHGRTLFPHRCEMVVKHDEGHPNHSLVARGEWDINFDEDGCIPSWGPLISQQCVSHSTRLYLADLIVPPGLEGIASTLCAHTPATIHGRTLFPHRCEMVVKHDEGHPNHSLVARGEWDVDFDEDGCIPSWAPLVSQQCVSFGSRAYYADLVVPDGLENIALTLCSSTPVTIHTRTLLPSYCEQLGEASFRGHWTTDFSESSCEAVWTSVNPDEQCLAYDKRRYTAILERIPEELDPLKTCYEAPGWLLGVQRTPELCDRDDQGRVMGSWFVGGPECRPVLFDVRDYGCIESGIKRIEGQVGDIGKNEDWYRLCVTIPYHWYRQTYLPVQCESRTSWAVTRRYAMYNIPDSSCA
ncbi:hypothetical protein D9758_013890 [Tetrapyrgos nigripes]|uniref:RING-type domain-containing protein n=1 Tax=Tetrapyrgos nigripes TaxID=182062 RepID=A0A8H5FQ60_9AGAR|nr:hypothetical protein D9758_013890 [Tetrapyrgos nigripes]